MEQFVKSLFECRVEECQLVETGRGHHQRTVTVAAQFLPESPLWRVVSCHQHPVSGGGHLRQPEFLNIEVDAIGTLVLASTIAADGDSIWTNVLDSWGDNFFKSLVELVEKDP